MMAWRVVAILARKEVRDALRNRWFLMYSGAFLAIALGLSALSFGGARGGFAGFGRTAASLVNLVLLVVPLMGLTLGAGTVAEERETGTLETLLAQPVLMREIVLGKYLGLVAALGAAVATGFGLAAALMAYQGGAVDAGAYINVTAFALLLGAAMLAVGVLISALSRRSAGATGAALVAWLVFVFASDFGLMGSAVTLRLDVNTLFSLTVANPLESYKVAAVGGITGALDVLGPAGVYATRTYGPNLPYLLAGLLIAWSALPVMAAMWTAERRGAA